MRIPFFSLKASVIAQLSFLILAAMLLCDVVMIRFAERDLIRAKIREARILAIALEGVAGTRGYERESFRAPARNLLVETGFESALVVDRMGEVILDAKGGQDGERGIPAAAGTRVARTGQEEVEFTGRTWAVMWFAPESIIVTVPSRAGSRNAVGISIQGSLIPLYLDLRASQKIVLLYIILDTLILALAGMVLLSRIVVRPIGKLLKMTEEYRGGDFLVPLEAVSGSEIRRLSRSLSNMIKRLEENKDDLKEHIASLEQANEELRQAQDEIIRSEKLASVGRLAAGVAHEIGNPIGIILGYLDLVARKDISEEERADIIQRVESEVTRISLIIRTLLDFSRASDNRPKRLSVHELIQGTIDILEPQSIMEDVHTELVQGAAEDEVFADPGRLKQVFLNVLINAADALSEKRFGEKEGERRTIRIETCNQGGLIEVRISDNGPGISSEGLSHIFDPFYTTKDPGKGTGLGLSVSHRIMEDLGGAIHVTSVEGRGTTAVIQLPLFDGSESDS